MCWPHCPKPAYPAPNSVSSNPDHHSLFPQASLELPTLSLGTGSPKHSLEDPSLLQAVLAPIPHGSIVHSLDGPINSLEDIMVQALRWQRAAVSPGDQLFGPGWKLGQRRPTSLQSSILWLEADG